MEYNCKLEGKITIKFSFELNNHSFYIRSRRLRISSNAFLNGVGVRGPISMLDDFLNLDGVSGGGGRRLPYTGDELNWFSFVASLNIVSSSISVLIWTNGSLFANALLVPL